MRFAVDVSMSGVSMCLAHVFFVLRWTALNAARLRRRKGARFRYKLYATALIRTGAQIGLTGSWLLSRFYTIGAFLLFACRLSIFARNIGISDMRWDVFRAFARLFEV